jgi:hypothetical protein
MTNAQKVREEHKAELIKQAQKIWEAFKGELTQPATDDMREALSTAIRAVGDVFEYDSYGLASLNADDFYKIADELDAL